MRGATIIEKLLYGVYLGDYVSYYLALLAGVDPSAMETGARWSHMLEPVRSPRSR